MKENRWLSPQEFAKRRGVHYVTVLNWLRAELVDGAEKLVTPNGTHHYYRIPESAVREFKAPKVGRKLKQ